MIDEMEQSSRIQRNLEVVVQSGLLLAKHLDLPTLVQAATDAGLQLCGAQFGAFFYNVIDARGESYLLYALSGVDPGASLCSRRVPSHSRRPPGCTRAVRSRARGHAGRLPSDLAQ